MREIFLIRWLAYPTGITIPPGALDLKFKERLLELQALCPTSKDLANSSIESKLHVDTTGAHVEFWLLEHLQGSLAFLPENKGACQPMLDGYSSELAKLLLEITAIAATTFDALSSLGDRTRVLGNDRTSATRKFVRGRARKRDRAPWLSGVGVQLPLCALLPIGKPSVLQCKIVSLVPRGVWINSICATGDEVAEPDRLQFPSTMYLARTAEFSLDARGLEALTALMDGDRWIQIKVAVALDSVTCQPVALEYRGQLAALE